MKPGSPLPLEAAIFLFMMGAFLLATFGAALVVVFLSMRRRMDRLEALLSARQPPAPSAPAEPFFPKPVEAPQPPVLVQSPPPLLPVSEPPLPGIQVPASPPPSRFNLELFMGVRLFAWLGGLAALLALAFFVKYSFDHELLPPSARLAIGALASLGLIGWGIHLRGGRAPVTSQTLCATGVVGLYAVVWACRAVYHFEAFSLGLSFALMAAITAGAVVLAVWLGAQVVAVLGMLGGFLTPLLLSSGVDNAPGLFSYLALLDAGIALVALRRGWHHLVLLAALATLAMLGAWIATYMDAGKSPVLFTVAAGFCVLFVGVQAAARRIASPAKPSALLAWAVIIWALASFSATWALMDCRDLYRQPWWGFGLLVLSDLALVGTWFCDRRFIAAPRVGAFVPALILIIWIPTHPGAILSGWIIALAFAHFLLHTLLPAILPSRDSEQGGAAPSFGLMPAILALLPYLVLILATTRLQPSSPNTIFAAALALLLATTVLAHRVREGALCLVAIVGLFHVEGAWLGLRPAGSDALFALFWMLGFYLLCSTQVFLLRRRLGDSLSLWVSAAVAGPLHAFLVHHLVDRSWPNDAMGAVVLGFAIIPAASLFWVRRSLPSETPQLRQIQLWLGATILLFITAAIPAQFHGRWLTLGWALEGLALVWLFRGIPVQAIRWLGFALLVIASARLVFSPAVFAWQARQPWPILNPPLLNFGVVALACIAAARLLAAGDRLARILAGTGGLLLFLLLNIEIADFFAREDGGSRAFELSQDFARGMTTTIAWALFALVLLVIGLLRQRRLQRLCAIGLLCLVLAKLFLHDLSELGQLYRIGALVGVAAIAILASYLYQRRLPPKA